MILSRYLDAEPAQLQFAFGSRGKPYLAGIFKDGGIRFNMSDSQDLALIALTRGREIGVDLEQIRPVSDIEQIVERYFSPIEISVFLSLPPDERLEAFFNGWTRKEAFVKALGEGLARPLDEFDVTLGPDEPARLIQIRDAPQEATRWFLQALVPAQDMVAALAVEGGDWRLAHWRWSERQAFPRSAF
jgi:4'-phosphopantetheinyl transferase